MADTLTRSSFQELMRQWEQEYPYNFVCIADARGSVDGDALRQAAIETLAEMRIGDVRFGRGRRYCYEPTADVEVRRVASVDADAVSQLNRPFLTATPVRLAVEPTGDGTTSVAVTFRHVAFDGQSASIFLRRTLLRALGAPLPVLEMGEHLQGRHALVDGFALLHPYFYARIVRDLWRMRSVYSRGRGVAAPDVACRFFARDPLLLTRLRRTADAAGMTVNDAIATRFVTALFDLLEPEFTSQRRTLGVTIPVSLRKGVAPLARGIGVAAFPVFIRSRGELPRGLHRQTDIEKRSRAYLRSVLGVASAAAAWSLRKHFGRPGITSAYVPTAGFSNVRIPAVAGDEHVTGFRAVASTGPFLPIMLIAITHGDDLRLSLSWRRDLFTAAEVEALERTLSR